MKTNVTERTYTIAFTVTDEEADFLRKELHKVYKSAKQDGLKDYAEKKEGMEALETYYRELGLLRDLRNAFANVLLISYVGEDA